MWPYPLGQPLSPSRSYDEDIKAYIGFLSSGLDRYSEADGSGK